VSSRDAELAELRTNAREMPPPAEPDTAELDGLKDRLATTGTELEELRMELRERDSQLAAAVERLSALTGEHESLQARLASAGSSAEDRHRELSEAHVQAANFNAELQALRPRLAAAEAELVVLRSHAAAADARVQAERDARAVDIESSARKVANANAAVARAQAQLADREAEVSALKAEAAERTRELETLRSRLAMAEAVNVAPAPAPADTGPHSLFVPRNGGYELVERDGPPPARGETVELDGTYVVAKVGPSPRPGEQRTCVYLVRA
jgi:chromosome segregation ATPase